MAKWANSEQRRFRIRKCIALMYFIALATGETSSTSQAALLSPTIETQERSPFGGMYWSITKQYGVASQSPRGLRPICLTQIRRRARHTNRAVIAVDLPQGGKKMRKDILRVFKSLFRGVARACLMRIGVSYLDGVTSAHRNLCLEPP